MSSTTLRVQRLGSNFQEILPEQNKYPLKIDGWKMTFPFKMVLFQGTFIYF